MLFPILDGALEREAPMASAVVAYAVDAPTAERLVAHLNVNLCPPRYRIGCLDETGLGELLRAAADFSETSLYRR